MAPLVSICIPTYNSAQFIEETLETLLNQTYDNYEIIIGDNASNDNTVDILSKVAAQESRVRYYSNESNLGYAGNCNKLIQQAKGKYIGIYHADDLYDNDIIRQQVTLLTERDDLVGVFTQNSFIDEKSQPIKRPPPYGKKPDLVSTYQQNDFVTALLETNINPFFCPSSMIRTSAYQSANGYDENMKFIEDQDMWIRLMNFGSLAVINRSLVRYRIHPAQGSYVYVDPKRAKLSPMIEHLQAWLKSNNTATDYDAFYRPKINRLIAVDHIRVAFHMAKSGAPYLDFVERLRESKKSKSIGFGNPHLSKFALLQTLPSRLTYWLLRKKFK